MGHKQYARPLSFKSSDLKEDGQFTGFVSTFNDIDFDNETFLPGAFSETIKKNNGFFPGILEHDLKRPIGGGILEEQGKGLYINGTINKKSVDGLNVYDSIRFNLEKFGVNPYRFSHGFWSIDSKPIEKNGKTIRAFTKVDLFEWTLTLIPANENAIMENIKSAALELTHEEERRIAIEYIEKNRKNAKLMDELRKKTMTPTQLIAAALKIQF